MRIKNEINKRKDIVYLVIAIFLTVGLAVYLFWFVHNLVKKTNAVFGPVQAIGKPPAFDFDRYDKIMQKILQNQNPAPPVAAPTAPPSHP